MTGATAELDEIETGLLLEAIHKRYGYDFRGYARSSLDRRLRHRAHDESVVTLSQLQGRILRDPHVMARLLDDLTISVSSMFRDPAFFAALRNVVLPRLRTYPYVRIWNAGCARGEEPWSLAILLHEAGLLERARIYATDLSEESLERASQGVVPAREDAGVHRRLHRVRGRARVLDLLPRGRRPRALRPWHSAHDLSSHGTILLRTDRSTSSI